MRLAVSAGIRSCSISSPSELLQDGQVIALCAVIPLAILEELIFHNLSLVSGGHPCIRTNLVRAPTNRPTTHTSPDAAGPLHCVSCGTGITGELLLTAAPPHPPSCVLSQSYAWTIAKPHHFPCAPSHASPLVRSRSCLVIIPTCARMAVHHLQNINSWVTIADSCSSIAHPSDTSSTALTSLAEHQLLGRHRGLLLKVQEPAEADVEGVHLQGG